VAALAAVDQTETSFHKHGVQLMREANGVVTVLRECSRKLARVGARQQFGARFGAREGSLLMENLDAEAFRFGGEGRNRPETARFREENSLILQVIQDYCVTIWQDCFTMVC
jgi:hypothetical protein